MENISFFKKHWALILLLVFDLLVMGYVLKKMNPSLKFSEFYSEFPLTPDEKYLIYKGHEKIPLPAITSREYMAKLHENNMVLIDTRFVEFPFLSTGKVNRFANTFYRFHGQWDIENYIFQNREELKNKEIIFLCYGSHEAKWHQIKTTLFLRDRGVKLNTFSFLVGDILPLKRTWEIQMMQFVPSSLADTWVKQGHLEPLTLDLPPNPSPAFWDQLKRDLSSHKIPVVIKTKSRPDDIEKNIFPLNTKRYYIVDNWKTPPKWIAGLAFRLNNVFSYREIMSFFSLTFFITLVFLRREEIQLAPGERGKCSPYLRPALTFIFFLFLYYLDFCFIQNHSFPESVLDYYQHFYLMLLIPTLSFFYSGNNARVLLNPKHQPENFWKFLKGIWSLKNGLLALPVVWGVSVFLSHSILPPHRYFSEFSFYMYLFLFAATAVYDGILFSLGNISYLFRRKFPDSQRGIFIN